YDENPERQSEMRRQHAIYEACTHFNRELDDMAREMKYGGLEGSTWRFQRVQVGRLVDSLPADVPGRESIIARLWTTISDVERAIFKKRVTEEIREIEGSLQAA